MQIYNFLSNKPIYNYISKINNHGFEIRTTYKRPVTHLSFLESNALSSEETSSTVSETKQPVIKYLT